MVSKSPVFFYSALYLSGIVFSNCNDIPASLFHHSTLFFLFVSLVIYKLDKRKGLVTTNILLGFCLFMTTFFAGAWNINNSAFANKNLKSFINQQESPVNLQLVIKQKAKTSNKTSSILVYSKKYKEHIILYSYHKEAFEKLIPGDILDIGLKLNKTTPSKDYLGYYQYLESIRCFNYSFVTASEIEKSYTPNSSWIRTMNAKRERFFESFRKKNDHNEWCDILIAITSGDKSYLERETVMAFKSSGSLHLMAVSGLHVGFVYAVVLRLLFIFGQKKPMKIIKSIITLILIWSYCAFSGFSDSSMRASIMISFFVLSWFFSGSYISLNALCASALFISVLKPHALYGTGFQLSYCAMLAILFINPYFAPLEFKSNILNYFKNIITISFSCQLGTSIISLTTFGEFPLYFLLANIIFIPATAIIIMLCSLLFLTGFHPVTTNVIMKIVQFLTNNMFSIAQRIGSLPGSLVKIGENPTEKFLTLLLLCCLMIYMVYRGTKNTKKL